MQQLARDEAGNVWEVDGQGNAVRPYQPAAAPAGNVFSLPPTPAQQQQIAASQVSVASTQQQMGENAREAARKAIEFEERNKPKLPDGYMMGPNGVAVRVPGLPVSGDDKAGEQRDRASRLNQLGAQINRVQQLYGNSVGATSGLSSIQDYLPSDANARFDAAGASLSAQGLAAFRVPGTGTVSDRDAIMFDRANLPTADTRDAAIEEQLRGLRSRVDEERKALGLPAQRWYADPGQGQRVVAAGGTKTVTDETKAPAIRALQTLLRSGAPDDEVRAAAAALNASEASVNDALTFRRKNPGYKGSYNLGALGTREEATTARERLSGSATGAFLSNAFNDAAAGVPGAVFGTDNLQAQQAAYGDASAAGSLVGGVAGASGLELGLARGAARLGSNALARFVASPRTADAVYGGIQGATTTGTPTGAVTGAGAGVAGGMFGRGAARTAGRALRGVTDDGVQYLNSAGVPLTVGQTLGGVVKGVEDRLSGVPVIGDVVRSRRLEGLREFNRTAFDQGLSTINATTGGAIAEEGIDLARAARSQAYRSALDPVSLKADDQFTGDMQGALRSGEALPDPMRGFAAYSLKKAGAGFSDGSPIQRVGQNDGWNQYIYQSPAGEIPFEVWPPSRGRTGIEIAIDENNLSGANRLGVKGMREAASHLKAEYPNAEYVYGTRTTGAGPGRIQEVDLSRVPAAEPRPGVLTGNGFQQALRTLRRDTASMAAQPYGADFGGVMRSAEDAFTGLLQRQSPGTLPAFNAANTANRRIEVLRDAVNRARNGTRTGETGVFAPSQLADAASGNARRFGNTAGTTAQPFFELSRAGQDVLPSQVPDSGTAGRLALLALPGVLGGGAGYVSGDAGTGAGVTAGGLALGGALALGGTRGAQQLATRALLDRPDALIRIGDRVYNRARIGGMFGAGLGATGATLLAQ